MLLSEAQLAIKMKKNIRTVMKMREAGILVPHIDHVQGKKHFRFYMYPDCTFALRAVDKST